MFFHKKYPPIAEPMHKTHPTMATTTRIIVELELLLLPIPNAL